MRLVEALVGEAAGVGRDQGQVAGISEFEQPGPGTQYVTSSKFCPDIPRTSVADLVSNGTLVRTNG